MIRRLLLTLAIGLSFGAREKTIEPFEKLETDCADDINTAVAVTLHP